MEYLPYQKLTKGLTRAYGLRHSELQGRMHIVRCDGSMVGGAAAITEACRMLVPIIVLCDVFNTPLAQRLYDFIARRRYRLFGCRESCYVPSIREARR
jgi:predicted DCC family thiol-disulfide oxidoreductase YuxK